MTTSTVNRVVAAGAVLGTLTAALIFWDAHGWVTRTVYAQDHEGASVETQQRAILKSLDIILEKQEAQSAAIDRNQDQWECDETDEELKELLDKEDLGALSAANRRQKSKLDEVWDDLNCSRFTD